PALLARLVLRLWWRWCLRRLTPLGWALADLGYPRTRILELIGFATSGLRFPLTLGPPSASIPGGPGLPHPGPPPVNPVRQLVHPVVAVPVHRAGVVVAVRLPQCDLVHDGSALRTQ